LVRKFAEWRAGKTQIARWILTELGSNEAASPTFAIHHRYDTAKFPVDHYDLYRMESDFDLDNTTFWDMINETDNLVRPIKNIQK
jgi:tRNA A37 threonylcarbamoyladenosine biosynthesis protein TsaE